MVVPSGDTQLPVSALSARGAGAHTSAWQAEALEARVMAMVAAHLREAEKMTSFLGKNVESRLGAVEQRQVQLERRMTEFTGSCRQAQPDTARPLGECQQHGQRSPRVERHQHVMEDEEEERQLRIAMQRAESLERRTQAAEEKEQQHRHHAHKSERVDRSERTSAKADIKCKVGTQETGSVALLAVQDLEVLLQAEMKAMHKRCTALQDTLDEHILLPLRDVEQRLEENDQKVRQLVGVGQDCSSRVEEHEFRLGVARTKLDVHDQKISRLEAMRWQRESTFMSSSGFTSHSAPKAAEPLTSNTAGLSESNRCH